MIALILVVNMSDKIVKFIADYINTHNLNRNSDDIRYIHFGYNYEQSEADLAQVRAGKKSAGFVVRDWFEIQKIEPIRVGLALVFADYYGVPQGIAKVVAIETVAYKNVTEAMTKDIAIGDGSLAQWQLNRINSLIDDCNAVDIAFSTDSELQIYWFELLYLAKD